MKEREKSEWGRNERKREECEWRKMERERGRRLSG